MASVDGSFKDCSIYRNHFRLLSLRCHRSIQIASESLCNNNNNNNNNNNIRNQSKIGR